MELEVLINSSLQNDKQAAAKLQMLFKANNAETIPMLATAAFTAQNKHARLSLNRLISNIAKIDVPLNQWPQLLPWLFSCCNSPEKEHREIGIATLVSIFDTLVDLQDHYEDLVTNMFLLFNKTIDDPESFQVKIDTVRCLGMVADLIELDEVKFIGAFQALVPKMVSVLEAALAIDDEDAASKGFEVFNTLLYLEIPVLTKHIGDLIQFSIQVASKKDLSSNLRILALNFLSFCVEIKKTRIIKLGIAKNVIHAMFMIGLEDEDEADVEDSPAKVAFQVLCSISISLPPTQVYPIIAELSAQGIQSPDFGTRKASLISYSVIVEGCADHMRDKIEAILVVVSQGLQDPHPIVRKAACMALCSLAAELGEEVGLHHAQILPLIFQLLNDTATVIVLTHAANALDSLVEEMGADDLVSYLPSLMEKLLFLLNANSKDLQATVLGAIGSIAYASEEKFIPYFEVVIPRLSPFLALSEEDDMLVRGVATDTLSAISEAVGPDVFRPYVVELMNIVNLGIQFKNSRLIECSFSFFGVMSRVFKDEFAPYVPHVVPNIILSLKQQEVSPFDKTGGEEDDEDIEEDEDDEEAQNRYSARSSIAEEKENSADTLGQIFSNTTVHFLPYVEESVNVLIELLDHYHEGCRKRSTESLFLFLHTFYKMSKPAEWVAGLPVTVPVHENVSSMTELVMGAVLKSFEDEWDKHTVINSLQCIAEALKTIGPALITNPSFKEELFKQILTIFKGEHLCQQDEIDDIDEPSNNNKNAITNEEDEDIEFSNSSESDSLLIAAACDAIGSISIALGAQFSAEYSHFHAYIVKDFKPSKSSAERSNVVGTLAEVTLGLKEAGIGAFRDEFLSVFSVGLVDSSDEVKTNAAWGIGMLYQESDISQHYMQILTHLQPLIQSVKPTTINYRDNALGAVARMILKTPSIIPLDQVVPILCQSMPLEKDHEEYRPIVEALIMLVGKGLCEVNMTWFFGFIGKSLGDFDDKTRVCVVEFLKLLWAGNRENFEALVGSVGVEYGPLLMSLVQ